MTVKEGRRVMRGETEASEPAAASCGERAAPGHEKRTSTSKKHYVMPNASER